MKEGNGKSSNVDCIVPNLNMITVESVRSLISKDRKVTIQWQMH